MRGPAPHPDGIPGSRLSGPWPVGEYAAALRDRLRGFTRVQVFGEVFGLKVGRAKVWFELRDGSGALPCAPVAAPVFRWNHNVVMHQGGTGLADLLGAKLLAVT